MNSGSDVTTQPLDLNCAVVVGQSEDVSLTICTGIARQKKVEQPTKRRPDVPGISYALSR